MICYSCGNNETYIFTRWNPDISEINSRQRVLETINHAKYDRIPIDYWAVADVTANLIKHFGLDDKKQLLQHLNLDVRYVMGPSFAGQQFKVHENGLVEDHWGSLRKTLAIEGTDKTGTKWAWKYKHLEKAPLQHMETVEEIDNYPGWPTADMWDYSAVKGECVAVRDAGYAVINGGDSLDRTAQLKSGMYIRGMEQFP